MGEPKGRSLSGRTLRLVGLGGIGRSMIRLKDVLAVGQKADAGLDLFWGEPPDPDDPIFSDNVMVKNDKRQI